MNLKSVFMLGGVLGVANLSHPREQGSKPCLERRPRGNLLSFVEIKRKETFLFNTVSLGTTERKSDALEIIQGTSQQWTRL